MTLAVRPHFVQPIFLLYVPLQDTAVQLQPISTPPSSLPGSTSVAKHAPLGFQRTERTSTAASVHYSLPHIRRLVSVFSGAAAKLLDRTHRKTCGQRGRVLHAVCAFPFVESSGESFVFIVATGDQDFPCGERKLRTPVLGTTPRGLGGSVCSTEQCSRENHKLVLANAHERMLSTTG